ncbi:hypothetical protein [Vibrio crassostreae]|uniref:hypothetical protein n=1 Tax=Vibrio crassostreae TaxID=246167 RepID=UPI001B316436|nr:hypothetical protein [Vibrio crassostreae]
MTTNCIPQTQHNRHTIAHLVITNKIAVVNAVARLHGLEEPTETFSSEKTNSQIALRLLSGQMPSLKSIQKDIEAWGAFSTFSMRNLLKGADLKTTANRERAYLAAKAERGRKNENRKLIEETLIEYCVEYNLPEKLANVHNCAILHKELPEFELSPKERFALITDGQRSEFEWGLFDKNGMVPTKGVAHLGKEILKNVLPRSVKVTGAFHDADKLNAHGLMVSFGKNVLTLSLPDGCRPSEIIEKDVITEHGAIEFTLGAEAELRGYKGLAEWVKFDAMLRKPLATKAEYEKALQARQANDEMIRRTRHHGVDPMWLDNLTQEQAIEVEKYVELLSRYAKSYKAVTFRDRKGLYDIKSVILKHMLKAKVATITEFIDRANDDILPESKLQDKVAIANTLVRMMNFKSNEVDGGSARSKKNFRVFVKEAKKLGLVAVEGKDRIVTPIDDIALADKFLEFCKVIADYNIDHLSSTVMRVIPKKSELYNIFHISDEVAAQLRTGDYDVCMSKAELALTKHYYSLWTVRCNEVEFHFPHTKLPRSYWDGAEVEVSEGDKTKKYGAPITQEEMDEYPLIKVLHKLNVDTKYTNLSTKIHKHVVL